MIVVDTNVIGYLFLSSKQSILAERALQKDNEWAAPISWRSEFRNVLTLYMRKDIIKLEQAQQIMNSALKLVKHFLPQPRTRPAYLHGLFNPLSALDPSFLDMLDRFSYVSPQKKNILPCP